jgi:hypothetical protein
VASAIYASRGESGMNASTITAEWLREPRPLNGVIPLSAELGPMLGDALELADDCARSCIELECRDLMVGGVRYYDLDTADTMNVDMEQPLRYLRARGLIEGLPDLHGGKRLVRFVA